MSVQLYKQYPNLYMFNSETKRHMLKASPKFKRAFRENPEKFSETVLMHPPMIPAPPVLGLPAKKLPEPQPDIGTLPPLPERVLTPEEVEKQLSVKMREKVREVVDTELKVNPEPYKNVKSPDLEVMLRALIIKKLGKDTIVPAKKGKPKPVFKLCAPAPSESDDSNYDEDDISGED